MVDNNGYEYKLQLNKAFTKWYIRPQKENVQMKANCMITVAKGEAGPLKKTQPANKETHTMCI